MGVIGYCDWLNELLGILNDHKPIAVIDEDIIKNRLVKQPELIKYLSLILSSLILSSLILSSLILSFINHLRLIVILCYSLLFFFILLQKRECIHFCEQYQYYYIH